MALSILFRILLEKSGHEILKLLRLSFIIKSDTGDLVADSRFPIPGSPESYKSIILILLRKLISVVEHHVHGSGMSRIGHNRWLTLPGKLLPSHSLRFRREVGIDLLITIDKGPAVVVALLNQIQLLLRNVITSPV